jgi:hypothetical protein
VLQLSDLFFFNSYSSILSLEVGRMRNGILYTLDPHAQPIQNVGLLDTFGIDFVILISKMCCERLIVLIQSYPIPFFECELDADGTIHIFLVTGA